jgi:hypothetical protein
LSIYLKEGTNEDKRKLFLIYFVQVRYIPYSFSSKRSFFYSISLFHSPSRSKKEPNEIPLIYKKEEKNRYRVLNLAIEFLLQRKRNIIWSQGMK